MNKILRTKINTRATRARARAKGKSIIVKRALQIEQEPPRNIKRINTRARAMVKGKSIMVKRALQIEQEPPRNIKE